MTLDERLVARIDRAARRLGTTRSTFTRDALRDALARVATRKKERRHRRGYEAKPVLQDEFDDWTPEQTWPDSSEARSAVTSSRGRTGSGRS